MRSTVVALSVLALTACATVGPNFVSPTADLSPEWLEANAGFEATPEELVEWWRIFEDPILDNLIDIARRENNDIKIAGLRVLEAQAQLGVAIGGKYPQQQFVAADATALQSSENNANTGGGGDLVFTQYNLGAGVAWEIDFWGRYRRGVESADASLLSSIATFDDALVLVTALVADIYTVIRTTEEQLHITQDNVSLQQRSYDMVEVLYRNGEASELDALQARTLLLGTEASIPALEITLRQAKHSLATLLGRSNMNVDDLLGGDGLLPEVPPHIAVGIPADLLRQRPDVRQAEMQAMALNALVGVAQADLYPSFSLFGSLGLSASDGTSSRRGDGGFFSTDSLTYSVGPSFVWPFFNYGRIRNNIRVQDARLQQALVNYVETVNQGVREVEDALVAFEGSEDQDLILREAVEVAQRSADLSVLRYTEGFADYQRVLDSQQRLFSQQQRFASNRGAAIRSLILLYRALGGGWQTRTDEDFVDEGARRTMTERTNWGDLLEEKEPDPQDSPQAK